MKKLSSHWFILLSSLLLTGCSTTITNLTPSTQKRTTTGLYAFEVELDTRERTIQHDSLKPFVLVGTQSYAMQPTLGLKNRWETVVPIPANQEYVTYRYKFNYDYLSIPEKRPGSRLSRSFQFRIEDK